MSIDNGEGERRLSFGYLVHLSSMDQQDFSNRWNHLSKLYSEERSEDWTEFWPANILTFYKFFWMKSPVLGKQLNLNAHGGLLDVARVPDRVI